jgi:hypothetical protein
VKKGCKRKNKSLFPRTPKSQYAIRMDEILLYTDIAHAIQIARANNLSDREIVRALTGSMTYEDARRIANFAAPLLEITVSKFLELRRNR